MPPDNHRHLFWTMRDPPDCLLCQGTIYAEDAKLVLVGPRQAGLELELGQCEDCKSWYGYLDDLVEVAEHLGWDLDEIEAFYHGSQPLHVTVWISALYGAMSWQEFREQELLHAAADDMPRPSDEELQRLLRVAETWELGGRVADWVRSSEDDALQLAHAHLVMDGHGLLRAHTLSVEQADDEMLLDLVYRAIAHPSSGIEAARPKQLKIDDEALVEALQVPLSQLGIEVEFGPTPRVREALATVVAAMTGEEATGPWLSQYAEGEVRSYWKAARALFDAKPWERLDGNKYLAFQRDDGDWYYCTVMGQAGEEYGLAMFEDWLQLCRMVHNAPSMLEIFAGEGELKQLEAAGWSEALTPVPLEMIDPEDASYLKQLGLRPLASGEYPVPYRMTPDGQALVHFSLHTYRALAEGLAALLSRRKAKRISSIKQELEAAGSQLLLRYPADGLEAVEDAGYYRLTVGGELLGGEVLRDDDFFSQGRTLTVEVPGETKLYRLARTLNQHVGDSLWLRGFGQGEHYLWADSGTHAGPHPCVTHLLLLTDLWAESYVARYPVHIEPLKRPENAELQVLQPSRS